MKNFALLINFALIICFSSCKKEDSPINTSVTAETKSNVAYGADPRQVMDIYLPAGRSSSTTKLIIMIHGGGWSEGDKSDFNSYVDTIKRRLPDYAIVNINYRLANASSSSNPFPTQENDVKSAFDFVNNNRARYLISDKWVALGASAGAHLAMLQAYKQATPKIKAVVNFFGPSDMVAMHNNPASVFVPPSSIVTLLQGTPTTNPTLYQSSSPINFVSATSAATITFHGSQDLLVRLSQQTALHARLSTSGVTQQLVTYPTEGHGWVGANLVNSFDRMQSFLAANVL